MIKLSISNFEHPILIFFTTTPLGTHESVWSPANYFTVSTHLEKNLKALNDINRCDIMLAQVLISCLFYFCISIYLHGCNNVMLKRKKCEITFNNFLD